MKRLAILALSIIFVSFLVIGTFAGAKEQITVSAAISLKNAFEEIGKLFEARNKDAVIAFNFGASGDLMAQIKGGAPVDVFASAALKDMDELEKAGLILKGTRTDFAANSVVLIKPASSTIPLSSFEDLKKAEVKKIAMGNPKTVPVGRYADEVFQYFKVSDMIKEKLVFAENVRQVLDYVARGEVDAGMVYATDALVRQQDVKVVAAAPRASHKPVIYPVAVVAGTKSEKAARAFIAFVISAEGKKILEKYGFKPVQPVK
jgi:molybdate transport system substrate-binding protein